MDEQYPKTASTRKPTKPPTAPACLDCARARKQGKPWGCLIHVAEGVL